MTPSCRVKTNLSEAVSCGLPQVPGEAASNLGKKRGSPCAFLSVAAAFAVSLVFWALLILQGPVVTHAWALEAQQTQSPPSQGKPDDIIVQGKLFCSLKRNVIMPFRGIVSSMQVQPGQRVKEGDLLLRYRLPPDMMQLIRRRLEPPQIPDLQARLTELDRSITTIDTKLKEARKLAEASMASPQSVENLEQERQFLLKNRAALQERIALERTIAKDDLALLKEQLGKQVKSDAVPQEASLVSPISGHVIGIHTEVREGAELGPGTPALVVGVLDPMLMKTQIHEFEAVKIRSGEKAEVTLESMPGRTFEATVTRLSWAPITPGVDQPSYYEIELSLPNPDLSLREGLKGFARFHSHGGEGG